MLLQPECRGLEPVYGVTPGALNAARALDELAAVRIGTVAIRAVRVRHGFLEIRAGMALQASHSPMFSQQRVCRFRVIELCTQRLRGNLFPTIGVVTGGAGSRHRGAVRIVVARVTTIKNQAGVFRFSLGSRGVTFLTRHLCVQSGERIACARVIKLFFDGHALPVIEVVALLTVLSEASVVLVFVTGGATARQSQEGMPQVFTGKFAACFSRDVLRNVTLRALQSSVFALQHVAGLVMIEFSRRGVPVRDREVFTIMFGVTGDALLLRF